MKSIIVSRIYFLLSGLLLASCSTTQQVSTGLNIGNTAPEIQCENTVGDCVPLSTLRGQYVLIEFWSSTCNSCRADHFEMERLYQEYKDTRFKGGAGFTIYSIALEEDATNWVKVLKDDRMSWPQQFCDTRKWRAPASVTYQVNTVPKYFLIDGDGKMIERNILIKDLEKILEQYQVR